MKPLHLNLATRPFRNNTAVGSVVAAVTATLVLATAANLYVFLNHGATYATLQQEERSDRAALAALEKEERALAKEFQTRDFRRIYERGKFANELIRRRAFSWTLLFNTLETVVPAEVMMSAIRPNITAEDIVVRVEGLAKTHGGFISFQDALIGSPAFMRVYPVNERKINPALPTISFALNFDYLPERVVPVAQAVATAAASTATTGAAAASPPAPQPEPSGAQATASGPPPASTGTAVAATPPPAGPAAKTPPAAEPGHAVNAAGTVGRDGRPRVTETLARLVAAPGGIYLPPAPPRKDDGKAGGGKKGKNTQPGPQKAAPSYGPAGPAAAPGGAGPAPPPLPEVPPVMQRGKRDPLPRDPNLARAAAARTDVPVKAAPAERLDVPLAFTARPAQEVYDALSRAHGVRFEFDPAVELQVKVTANLGGRKLPEALAVVGRVAGHRIVREGDGRYRVVLAGGGESIADKPVREEDLGAPETGP